MGLFRKLAEYVVEFPEEEKPSSQQASGGDDVVAAIEKIRLDLESGGATDFSATGPEPAPVDTPRPSAPAEDAPAPAAGGLVQAANRHIPLPRFLAIPEIYEQAKVPPATIDIYRIEEMLGDPEIADLDPEMRARMVRMTLKNMDVDLNDILADAGRRDHALEEYRKFLDGIIQGIADQIENTNAEIQREVDDFVARHQAVIAKNQEKLKVLKDSKAEFMRSKEAEEQRLFDIAAPFVKQGQNPVDIGSKPAE